MSGRRFVPFLALTLTCAVAHAQTINPVAPEKGAYSVGFSAEFDRTQGFSLESTFFVTPTYFATDNLELRVPLGFAQTIGPEEVIWGLGFHWHFVKKKRLDPFVGAVYEHASNGNAREDLTAALAGLNYFVANNVAITGTLTVGSDRNNISQGTSTSLNWGFTIFFSGK